jgi:2-polyprenyl-3-methyl-5-hydroxy-6-metoxy-1,4-benzoquinol methylase
MQHDEYKIMFDVEDSHWWYRGLRANLALFWERFVATRDADERPASVLDVGCGTGAVLQWLSARAKPTGVDFAQEAIHFCRERGHEQCAVASALALPCAKESFDVVLSFDVICHKSVPEKIVPLREMRDALKPSGILFLNLPAYQWLMSSHDAAVYTNHRFNRTEIRDMLESLDFEILAITHWNTLLFPIILAVRLFRKAFPPKQSDLADKNSPLSNNLFGGVMKIERALMRLTSLPFGLSIFIAARKK